MIGIDILEYYLAFPTDFPVYKPSAHNPVHELGLAFSVSVGTGVWYSFNLTELLASNVFVFCLLQGTTRGRLLELGITES